MPFNRRDFVRGVIVITAGAGLGCARAQDHPPPGPGFHARRRERRPAGRSRHPLGVRGRAVGRAARGAVGGRGFTIVDCEPDACSARWTFVDTLEAHEHVVTPGRILRGLPGSGQRQLLG
jgi:hypothetical protein